ncbi:GNAT family N-acetyltransferase [Methylocystis sp. S23]|jgi:CelD/BcsL family acetyltransferase involved in cellulose biosynthesis
MSQKTFDTPISIEEIADASSCLDFREIWLALFASSPYATPFQSWEWISACLKHYAGDRPLILVAKEGETPIAAMALAFSSYRGTRLRLLRWLGAPIADYHDFVGERRREECAAAFLRRLRARDDWHVCDLSDLRPASISLLSQPLGVAPSDLQPCATLKLPATRAELDRASSGNLRSMLKRRAKQLKADHGDFVFSTVSDAVELPEAMADLFRLHTARLKGKGEPGAFSQARSRAFHCEVAGRFLEAGILRLHRLQVGRACVAALYCFHLKGVTYYYLGGFDPAFARYSPGALILNHAIGAAIEEGDHEFDFMRGAEAYKARWKAEPRANGRLIFGRDDFISRIAVASRRLERRLSHLWRSLKGDSAAGAAAPDAQSSNTPSSA